MLHKDPVIPAARRIETENKSTNPAWIAVFPSGYWDVDESARRLF